MRIIIDKTSDHPNIFDTSELLRPEEALKEKEAFRDYSKDDVIGERVRRTYYEMHTNQTVEFVKQKHEKWLKFDHMEATIMEALVCLAGVHSRLGGYFYPCTISEELWS